MAVEPEGVDFRLRAPRDLPGKRSSWHGYDRYDFTHGRRRRLVVAPRSPAPYRPWIWRPRFFGHEPRTDLALSAKVPLLHVVGLADTVVPVEENTRIVEQRYRKLGGKIEVIAKKDCGHHPHSLKDPARIVAFVLKHAS